MNDPEPPAWLTAVQATNRDVSAIGLDFLILDPDVIAAHDLGAVVAEAVEAVDQEQPE